MDYYIPPLKADCEDLLNQFQKTESVRYEEFTAIWRKMNFSSIFYGKMAGNEMRAFSRLILTIAYQYFLPPYNFQIRVGGLYLLYGLYHSQLASPKEKIRFALKDWENVQKFQTDAMNAQHYDVTYILRRLFSEKAIYFAAMPKQLSFQVKRKATRHTVCEEFWDRPTRVKDLITSDTMEEIMNVHEHYEKVKAAFSATPGQPDSGIHMINKDLAARMQSTVMRFHKWQEETESRRRNEYEDASDTDAGEGTSKQSECSSRAQLLASIKSKSYGQVVEASRSRRHRQTEMDTSPSKPNPAQGTARCKKPMSLRERTRKKLMSQGSVKQEALESTTQWRLSMTEQDKLAERRREKKPFKW
ncbi:snRNA-activating protein complex subunit 1b [Megalops cyprinoides]|uniref:snRNA-activating protein complex subunit 1b n=1 Tax=Megalops cyprinoides TaxID=118141 RepID=UPI001864019E|nr:snRNA-activating protein complex subunit 1b [Megalops cyprinoides]